jgi:hypothetical protein
MDGELPHWSLPWNPALSFRPILGALRLSLSSRSSFNRTFAFENLNFHSQSEGLMTTSRFIVILFLFGFWLLPATASAQAANQAADIAALRAQLDALRTEYQTRIQDLERQLQTIQSQLTTVPPAAEAAVVAPAGQSVTGGSVTNAKPFNPDIAVIGDFLGAAGRNRVNPSPALEMHESELSLQAVVDPYARADFFLSFGHEGVELEEGFLTFPSVPGGLLVKAGKMRAAFGRVNALHNHMLPWTDRPLVTQNLVAGEEGIGDAGVSVARLIPNPWIFLEATGQVYRGNSEGLFTSSKRGDLTYVGHLRGYQDITENTNVDLGFSYSRGHNDSGFINDVDLGRFRTTLLGGDATIRWKPLQRSVYHSFVGRSEFIWSRRQQPGGVQSAKGFYVSADYQLARRWFLGGRYDRADHADDALLRDKGGSLILTFWPSEFSQLRGQYRRTKFGIGETADELLMQLQFNIGAHGAHPF